MYPNPVVNKTIKLKFNNRQPGIYQIKIMNTNAAVQYSHRLTNTGNLAQSINLSQTLAPGIYYLQIVAPDNTSITQKIVVQ
ncbi:MAG: T9SS type A sorting domain-containing protein, partial [Aquabacterium sp.]|nr:T9SS type A sorting domain-containing protein [Ferruginibacter sp.]